MMVKNAPFTVDFAITQLTMFTGKF